MPDHFHDDPAWQEAYEIRARKHQEAGFTPAAQAAAMRAEPAFDGREAAFEKDFRSREGMSAEYAARLAKIGMIDDHGNMKNYYFEHLEAAGALDTPRADFFARYKQTPAATPDPQPRNDLGADDEERRRAGRGGGGNPANASHSFNIRPDVVAGPSGLEVRTTMKSVDYPANPDLKAELAEAERSAREDKQQSMRQPSVVAERGANQPTLTLEAIERDPWNAVELPLPDNPGEALLKAARSAAEYCAEGEHELMVAAREGRYTPPGWTGAEGEPDVHEYNEGNWLQADARLGAINEQIDRLEGRGVYAEGARPSDAPPLTNAEHDLYLETLKRYAPDDSVYHVLEEQLYDTQANHAFPPVVDALKALLPDADGVSYPWPQTFGQVLQHIDDGVTASQAFQQAVRAGFEADDAERRAAYDAVTAPTRDDIADRLARGDRGPDEALTSDQVLRRTNEESVKREDAERPTRSPEDVSGEPASPATPSLADDLRAAERAAQIERESEGQGLATQDHGEGKTPGGCGGGRGMF
jgi:hypothetical protein